MTPPDPISSPNAVANDLRHGVTLMQAGRLAEAVATFEAVVEAHPDHADANYLLGVALHRAGRGAQGLVKVGRAAALAPFNAAYRANLAALQTAQGQLDEAVLSYQTALRISPDDPRIRSDLGDVLFRQRRFAAAAGAQQQALALAPGLGVAEWRLAAALVETGQLDEARAAAERSVALDAKSADAHHMLGRVQLAMRRPLEAARSLREAARIRPDSAICTDLARSLRILGKNKEAIAFYRAAIDAAGENIALQQELVAVLLEEHDIPAARQLLEKMVRLAPHDADIQLQLHASLLSLGLIQDSRDPLQRALELAPDSLAARSAEVFAYSYAPDAPVAEAVDAAKAFGREAALRFPARSRFPNSPDPGRQIRVGLVSSDLHEHPVGRFTVTTLPLIDRGQVELFAYANSAERDGFTDAIERSVSHWRMVAHDDDDKLEATILADEIDILLDMSGHTGGNRLPVFARKPAPVAVTWLGFFATTGLNAIDYVLATRHVIPPGEEWQWVETPWRLPETYLCFAPPDVESYVGPPPAMAGGLVTFGSANNINKVNDRVVQCWAAVLAAVPQSRLQLRYLTLGNATVAAAMRARFAAAGIVGDRLILDAGESDYARHLGRYGEIDIALDPFPYSGGTTTVEALWMGVPVLTLRGDRYAAHMGENILHNVGMADWIADNLADYVEKAKIFAANLDGLAARRLSQRQRLLASPMMNAPRFARQFEQALRGMWQAWCATQAGHGQ